MSTSNFADWLESNYVYFEIKSFTGVPLTIKARKATKLDLMGHSLTSIYLASNIQKEKEPKDMTGEDLKNLHSKTQQIYKDIIKATLIEPKELLDNLDILGKEQLESYFDKITEEAPDMGAVKSSN